MLESDWEETLLQSIEGVSPALLQFFEEHGVHTVGALLGATGGLTNAISIEGVQQDVVDAFIARLLEELPESLLNSYRSVQPEMPPPGVLPCPQEEVDHEPHGPRLSD